MDVTFIRKEILEQVRKLAGKPVAWTSARTSMGDFEGRDWTIEVFDVPFEDRLAVRQRLWDYQKECKRLNNILLSFISHDVEATTQYYSWARSL